MANNKKRISKTHKSHETRARSIANGLIRKKARSEAQKVAERRNRARGYTTWDVVKARRTARLGRTVSPTQRDMLDKHGFNPETGQKKKPSKQDA